MSDLQPATVLCKDLQSPIRTPLPVSIFTRAVSSSPHAGASAGSALHKSAHYGKKAASHEHSAKKWGWIPLNFAKKKAAAHRIKAEGHQATSEKHMQDHKKKHGPTDSSSTEKDEGGNYGNGGEGEGGGGGGRQSYY